MATTRIVMMAGKAAGTGVLMVAALIAIAIMVGGPLIPEGQKPLMSVIGSAAYLVAFVGSLSALLVSIALDPPTG